jgi:hypothetical protein
LSFCSPFSISLKLCSVPTSEISPFLAIINSCKQRHHYTIYVTIALLLSMNNCTQGPHLRTQNPLFNPGFTPAFVI